MAVSKTDRRSKIKQRIRKKVRGTAEAPRLSVYRSNAEIYAQLIDDRGGKTLVAVGSSDKTIQKEKANKTEAARIVGKTLAERAVAKGISNVVFDRNGFLYHGRVKSLADGAREGGLKF
jgi:large subunit ribosomal protein L18